MESLEARNVTTVQGIYQSFLTGDIPGIVATLADDVAWESFADNSAQKAGVPWMQAGQGPAGAMVFFQAISSWKPLDFQVLSTMAGGNQVAVEVQASFELASGRQFTDEEVHLWTFNEAGKVSRFRHYVDTAKHIDLAK